MRILLINQYAGAPSLGMEYRPHWMATEWQRLGHEVLVVAGNRSHLRQRQPVVGYSTVEGIRFRTLATPPYTENGARRFLNILAFRAQLYRAFGDLQAWRPDVVIASSTHPMDIRPSLKLARNCGALFVHEVHDLWPLTPKLLGGMSDRHPMIMWMQREEDLACREADLVVSMLPATLPYLKSRGLDSQRWAHVSNGVPESAVAGESPSTPTGHEFFQVGYFGGHGLSNQLETLIEAARLLKDEPVEFHLTGSGPLKSQLQLQAAGLNRVHFHDPVSPDRARRIMRDMDALCIVAGATPLHSHGISPNKIFDYMSAGRPLIQAMDAPSSPVQQVGCGVVCDAGDPEMLAVALADLMSRPTVEREEMGRSGWEYVSRECTHPKLASRFVDLLLAAAERQSH